MAYSSIYPEVWPDKKYEKKDNEYGTYIRSKASLDAEKAENGEEEEEEEEEISAKFKQYRFG